MARSASNQIQAKTLASKKPTQPIPTTHLTVSASMPVSGSSSISVPASSKPSSSHDDTTSTKKTNADGKAPLVSGTPTKLVRLVIL